MNKKLKEKFDKTMQFYSPQDLDGRQHWLDFLREVYNEGKKTQKKEIREKITAQIKIANNDSLWLLVNNGDESTAHPILEEEVKPIMEACKKHLKKYAKKKGGE